MLRGRREVKEEEIKEKGEGGAIKKEEMRDIIAGRKKDRRDNRIYGKDT